ncbi:MAG TPA: PLP-dependent aminotransferase family protein [Bryobacteraceae bacterium]|nr:PLP-dependent aminotransferase family protein [Bryobacteraceae bacterium]
MDLAPLSHQSDSPLYRQLFDQIAQQIRSGRIGKGTRLPATRELAGQLGLNRTTVSAAYELLEAEGLISGQVGRGSFVTAGAEAGRGVDWNGLLDRADSPVSGLTPCTAREVIRFVVSQPSSDLFPLDAFRASCTAVLERKDLGDVLQLGSPSGYEPLRRHLLQEARKQGTAGAGDDLLITNGCQQALDLIGRVLLRPGDPVAVEDPIYPGLKNLLSGMGAQLVGIPVGPDGMDVEVAARVLARERPRFLVVTSNFQNPTGATMPPSARESLLAAAHAVGVPVIENDAYGELRYRGQPVPSLKQLDQRGGTVLLRSFSKVSFPGLRVGWVLGPKTLVERLRNAKEASDLHTDQLSQAVLLEFVETGRLEAHRACVLQAGAERLAATLEACREHLPEGTRWSRPEGGMNVWVRLPAPLDAGDLLPRAQQEGIAYLPGRYFEVSRRQLGALRLSFAGLTPGQIRKGLDILGRVAAAEIENAAQGTAPSPALV